MRDLEGVNPDLTRQIKLLVGGDRCDDSLPTRKVYQDTHGMYMSIEPDYDFLPGLVVWPKSVSEVSEILMIANEKKVPVVVRGGGSSQYGAQGLGKSIVMDICMMDKILEFSAVNGTMTGEAGVRMSDWVEYAAKRGYTTPDTPATAKIATLGARLNTSAQSRWQGRFVAQNEVRSAEVVLANGDIFHLDRGSGIPSSKGAAGYNLLDLFAASWGTLGVITKLTTSIVRTPPDYKYGISGFSSVREGMEAYIELKHAISIVPVWRVKYYHKVTLQKACREMEGGNNWPEDIPLCVDYNILGTPEVCEESEKYIRDIISKHNGFWREDLPPTDFIGKAHESMEKFIGSMGSIETDRVVNGGLGNRMLFIDPCLPNSSLADFLEESLKHVEKLTDGNSYPSLAKLLRICDTGSGVMVDHGFSLNWITLNTDTRPWDEKERKEIIDWFREFAELVWKYNGSVYGCHHWIPRELEVEFLKKELGEAEYELGRKIKDLFDPNHILNPTALGYYK